MEIFRPNQYVDKLLDIDFKQLKSMGFKYILMDVDNTLVPCYEKIITEDAVNKLKYIESFGFKVIIFSNNTKKRVSTFLNGLDYAYTYWSFKPTFIGFIKVKKMFKCNKNELVVIGDQLMTDVLGGNMHAGYSILVKPLVEQDLFSTKINRFFERRILKKLYGNSKNM